MILKIALITMFIYFILLILFGEMREKEPTFNFIQDMEHFNATLAQLLKPRYTGALGHEQVIDFLMAHLKELGFSAIADDFYVDAYFTNVMGIWNKNAEEFLVLSCHFDSQNPGEGDNATYLGATDGAVPCAIILNVAKTLGPYLRSSLRSRPDIGIVLVFFDNYKPLPKYHVDLNVYGGSRHFIMNEPIPLHKIMLLIHFNFIGAANQTYKSGFEETNYLHDKIADIERELQASGEIEGSHILFQKEPIQYYGLQGDFYPFYKHDVPVLNIAPEHFLEFHNTPGDNVDKLHWPTISNMIKIMQKFVHGVLDNSVFEWDDTFHIYHDT
ncbi:glutaminyl-peptide cyclotransferase [Drosophila bipectinata]|uniref:glutaminyl-peptide cyclotransferase n=1 Tax=Drosophila bipectinata TaxID=42026 RepID=UPI001C897647|nr:glutaminyl-peptide cyclotransferase [Drosophila bipectinata]